MRRVRLIIISMLLICFIESFAFADSQFTDIKENVWYSEGVSYVVSKGYMVGTGYRRFDPNKTLNRAQLAQILYAYDGKPEIEVEDFVDTKKNSWFSSAATYVTKGGSTMFDYPPHLETGYFDPYATVTREQFVFVLYNFSWRHDKDMEIDSISWEKVNKLKDINEECREPFAWAVGHGLIKGTNKGLEPTSVLTRGQIATILLAYDKMETYHFVPGPADN